MPLTIYADQQQVTAWLSGEIDHHGAGDLRRQIDEALGRWMPKQLLLDFRDVTFMDSSGIGLVMGRYRLIRQWEGQVIICDPAPSIRKVMRLAGLDRIAKIENTPPGTVRFAAGKEEEK